MAFLNLASYLLSFLSPISIPSNFPPLPFFLLTFQVLNPSYTLFFSPFHFCKLLFKTLSKEYMEEFSHLGSGPSSRSTAPFSYFPSSSTRQPPPPPPPPPLTYTNFNPNPNPKLHPKSETNIVSGSSSQNTYYARRPVPTDHEDDVIKAKIISHPNYSALLAAYMDCQKVGAPPEVAARLSEIAREIEARQQAAVSCRRDARPADDPELDQFMEAYCNMLMKYREELARPLQEGMDFLRRIESELNSLTNGATSSIFSSTHGEKCEGVGSSEDDEEGSGGGGEASESSIDPHAEDKELKHHLLKKYSGYLSSLRHELSKKKKKGKLPKEARQKLLNWWELHYKWPYPSEAEKVALAASTGLDQKQINNWFINQRKRHWKPSEDMQFVVMEAFHPQNSAAAFYMGSGQYMGDASYRFGP